MNNTENTSPQLNELFGALAKAQSKIRAAAKDQVNPFFKSKYTDLAGIWSACREALSSNGLCVVQTVEGSRTEMYLTTWLGHSSGQFIKSTTPIILSKPDVQALGSSITYTKRYCLAAIVGIASGEEDDDGNAATHEPEPVKEVKKASAELSQALIMTLVDCSPEYNAKIKAFLASQKLTSFTNVSSDLVEKMLQKAKDDKEAYKKLKAESEEE